MSKGVGSGSITVNRQKVQQALEMLMVLDKNRTGKVTINNFMKIAQVSSLFVDNIELMRHTDERKNTVDYAKLTKELLKQAA